MRIQSGLAVLAAGLLSSGIASAATYNLGGNGGNLGPTEVFSAAGAPDLTITAGSSGLLNFGATIFQSPDGLGVNGFPDTQPSQIDGNPVGSAEFLTITFGWAVRLLSFALSDVDDGIFGIGSDEYDISINGEGFINGLTALFVNPVNRNNVSSFTIRASGSFALDRDDFKLSLITVAPVPVPAAGLMLISALGGLFVMRRRVAA